MSIRKYFLGWDRPLLDLANDFLKKELLNKSGKTLVVVPSKQAARKLKQCLRDNSKIKNRIIVETPEKALDFLCESSLKPATSNEKLLAWTLTLKNIEFDKIRNIFPITPQEKSTSWAIRTSKPFISLKNSLSEGALNISDVIQNTGEDFIDLSRWHELELLEKEVENLLNQNNSTHLSKPLEKAKISLDDFEEIYLVGLPDPPKLLTSALGHILDDHKINIVIYAPEDRHDSFDMWGKPNINAWSNHKVNIPDSENSIHIGLGPSDQAQTLSRIISGYSDPQGIVGIINNDSELLEPINSELKKIKLNSHNPSGKSCASNELYATISLFYDLVISGSFESAIQLLKNPDIIDSIISKFHQDVDENPQLDLFAESSNNNNSNNSNDSKIAEALTSLNLLKEKHLPTSLNKALKFSSKKDYPKLTQNLLEQLHEWMTQLSEDLNENLPLILQFIYSNRHFDSEGDREFNSTAKHLMSLLEEMRTSPLSSMSPGDQLDFILTSLRNEITQKKREPDSLEIQGWLEALWDENPHLIITGVNEGCIPFRIEGNIFLPDSMKKNFGLRTNDSILARDNYILNSILNCRRHNGRVDLILGKNSMEGNPLKPSRLLFQCEDNELADRALNICSKVDSSVVIHPWKLAWKLKPKEVDKNAKIFTEIAVTKFKDFLSCPFRFYLNNLMDMNDNQIAGMEMNPRQFGSFVHSVLEDFGNNESIKDSTEEGEIIKYLESRVDARCYTLFGSNVTVPLAYQIKSIKERLKWFSSIQARERSLGWKIIHSEFRIHNKRSIEIGGLKLRGTVDRVDYNEKDDTWRILDYKTSTNAEKPSPAHLKNLTQSYSGSLPDWCILELGKKRHSWTNLQLPLYVHTAKSIFEQRDIASGYFNLTNSKQSTKIDMWTDLNDEHIESAVTCAENIANEIKNGNFWPPSDKVKYDNYSDIFFDDCESSFDPSEITNK